MKKKEPKITYTYIEPKTPQEAEEAHRRLASAYDILFAEVLKRRRAKGRLGPVGQYCRCGMKYTPSHSITCETDVTPDL